MRRKSVVSITLAAAALLLSACAQATATERIVVVTATIPPSPAPPNDWILQEHPDWLHYSGEGFGVWLPPSYAGGSDPAEIQRVADTLRQAGRDDLASLLEANAGYVLLYAVDASNQIPGFATNFNVVAEYNSQMSSITMEEYADATLSQLATVGGVTVSKTETWSSDDFDTAYKLTSQYDLQALAGVPGYATGVQYLLKAGDHVWVLSFATPQEEFADRQMEFEDVAASFHE
ncbi:MAG: hypothetical protein WD751_03915 [Anaerolineales bacterium]